ncbi:hypothetical protein FDP41_006452 [Naegleria fowleri]|uniref:F-box domain-containing protein n=1 Tax=Naegleria fowleri TaxID=5763 RepID=A0A6A5BK50_NAEFO|nr:uncharacterized protein FDP41_006452 [Naegleria fowleri]KAF0974420.1 hypothetical protein FDP41_006452 [Naegleria fowleri]CAG4717914.1 unnamed protein product [Naegleria fowleri]
MGQSVAAASEYNKNYNHPPLGSDPISELYQAGKTNLLAHDHVASGEGKKTNKSNKQRTSVSSSTAITNSPKGEPFKNKGYLGRVLHSTSESESSSLHSLLGDDDVYEDDDEEKSSWSQAQDHRSKVTTKRWLLSTAHEQQSMMRIHDYNFKEPPPSKNLIFKYIIQNSVETDHPKMFEIIILMACSDLLHDICKLRLVCKLFNKIIEESLNFVAFQLDHKSVFTEDEDSEELENLHYSERKAFCHKLKISRNILFSLLASIKQHQDRIPRFLLNSQRFHYCFDLNETECQVKLKNPFIQSRTYEGVKNELLNTNNFVFLQELELFVNISNNDLIPHNFSIIAICRETSSYEECLFRFHTSISNNAQRSEDQSGLSTKTRLYPYHKKMFFESPTKTSSSQISTHVNLNFELTEGRYSLKFKLSNDYNTIQVKVIDIEHQTLHYELQSIPLMHASPSHVSQINHSRQHSTPSIMIDHFLIITSSSDRNICKRVTLSASIMDSGS